MPTVRRTKTGLSGQTPSSNDSPTVLHTTVGNVALHEYRATFGGHAYRILHTGAVLTFLDEQILLSERETRLPYGVALWPGAIALAHEIAARPDAARGRRVLELGAGTGLPGIVAASLGAHVVQTDKQQAALTLCRLNAERNGVSTVEHRLADWAAWDDANRYDRIIGSDILYATAMHRTSPASSSRTSLPAVAFCWRIRFAERASDARVARAPGGTSPSVMARGRGGGAVAGGRLRAVEAGG